MGDVTKRVELDLTVKDMEVLSNCVRVTTAQLAICQCGRGDHKLDITNTQELLARLLFAFVTGKVAQ